ncbi:MAG: protein kinase [Chloroflexota bacterium]|nr:protein kinase [Chloroflexota bacterium]
MPRCPNPRCQAEYTQGTFQCVNPFCQCLLPGAVIAGRYVVEALIGLGGMGAVYRVNDTFDMQQVALKVISTTSTKMDSATAMERFRREARYARQLRHKNIVPVLNFGQDGSWLYLVMPLVTGGTLKSLLKGEQPLAVPLAQRYLHELADAIDAVHAHPQQIVHRDIKPSNLLIHQDDGRLVLADFGIARAMQKETPLTQRGWAVGTEHYVAPEQEHGNPQPSSDIYSMGVVAYQMFTGLLPFQAIVRSHAAELPAPSELNPLLNPGVDEAIRRAMEIEPEKRFPTGHAFADAVNEALALPPTIIVPAKPGTVANANVKVRTIIPENPCGACGRENRSVSHFCRYCGHTLDETSPLVTDVCQVGYVSDTGRRFVAKENEDMLLIVQGLCVTLEPPPRPFGLFAVADGLRGPQGKSIGGHEASHLAVETVADELIPRLTVLPAAGPASGSLLLRGSSLLNRSHQVTTPTSKLVEHWLMDSVQRANQVVYHCNADYFTAMASTLTLALLHKHHLYVVSVGDSRAYHYNPTKGIDRITTEISQATNAREGTHFTPDELYASEERNRLHNNLGHGNYVRTDLFQREVEVGDLILLCTDGLWRMLRDEEIADALAQGGDTQKLTRTLVDAANKAGGEGNISAIVVRVQ